jgi:hypothetical protein
MGRQTNIGRWRPIVQGRRRRVFDEELDRIFGKEPPGKKSKLSVAHGRKKAVKLVPTRAKEYRLMANTFQALAVLAARRRGQVGLARMLAG